MPLSVNHRDIISMVLTSIASLLRFNLLGDPLNFQAVFDLGCFVFIIWLSYCNCVLTEGFEPPFGSEV